MNRIFTLFCMIVILGGTLVFGADKIDTIAQQTGLDRDLIGLISVEIEGTTLAITFIYVNERTLMSRISPVLRRQLLPYVEANAIVVWVSAEIDIFFSPDELIFGQHEQRLFSPSREDWAAAPPKPWKIRAQESAVGLLIMGERIDPTVPFWIEFRGEKTVIDLDDPVLVYVEPLDYPVVVPQQIPVDLNIEDLALAEAFGITGEEIAWLIGIDPKLVQTMFIGPAEEQLQIILIHLAGQVRKANLSPGILTRLERYIDRASIIVLAISQTGADFSPWNFWVSQGGRNHLLFAIARFTELTPGFLRPAHTGRIEAGETVAGIIILYQLIDPSLPFTLYYRITRVEFLPRD
ncbi:hypothetical protein LM597_01510 [Candidatus Acetothermia bacterium]|nr:hypothetical protein [Candidatus Acetothermia bacterium]